MTVLETLAAATGYLDKHGVESPRLNAEHLLAHALGKKRLDLYLEFDRPLSDAERAPLRDLVKNRGNGKPLQHLLGTAEFFGRSFLCDARALIPRPETEQLIELILSTLKLKPATLLDVGTGSGVIAITLALELPGATVTATDLSPDALSLAQENASRHALAEKLAFFETDLFPEDQNRRFDLIVANLPYIASDNLAALPREVQSDPVTALDGGRDGLAIIERLILQASERLNAGGTLALEIGHDQAPRVREMMIGNGFEKVAGHRDYQEIRRFVVGSR